MHEGAGMQTQGLQARRMPGDGEGRAVRRDRHAGHSQTVQEMLRGEDEDHRGGPETRSGSGNSHGRPYAKFAAGKK